MTTELLHKFLGLCKSISFLVDKIVNSSGKEASHSHKFSGLIQWRVLLLQESTMIVSNEVYDNVRAGVAVLAAKIRFAMKFKLSCAYAVYLSVGYAVLNWAFRTFVRTYQLVVKHRFFKRLYFLLLLARFCFGIIYV